MSGLRDCAGRLAAVILVTGLILGAVYAVYAALHYVGYRLTRRWVHALYRREYK